MSIKVTVLQSEVVERSGTFKDDSGSDRAYTTRVQKARMEAGGFAYPYDVRLEDGQQPYAAGDYELDVEQMAQVNKGKLALSKFTVLRKLSPSPAKAP